MRKSLTILLILFWCTGHLTAQSYRFIKQIKGFDLSTENVTELQQDHNGFIWVATDRSIKFSDGVKEESLPDSIQSQLRGQPHVFVDKEGWVWVYLKRGVPKVFYLKDKKWHELPLSIDPYSSSRVQYVFNLSVLGTGDEKNVSIVTETEMIVQDLKGERIEHGLIDSDSNGVFRSMFQHEGIIYFLFEKGVVRLSNNKSTSRRVQFRGEQIRVSRVVFSQEESSFYYLGKDGLYRGKNLWQPEEKLVDEFSAVINSPYEMSGLSVNGRDIYFFLNSQLNKLNGRTGKITQISVSEELKVPFVQASLVDREGHIWIGTYRGGTILEGLRFQNFDRSVGLQDTDISAIGLFGEGRYALGYNNGMQLWQGQRPIRTFTFESSPDVTRGRVMNFYEDQFGGVWVSAFHSGLKRLNVRTQQIENHRLPCAGAVNYVTGFGDKIYAVCQSKIFSARLNANGDPSSFEEDLTFLAADGVNNFIRKISQYKGKWIIMDNDTSIEPVKVKQSEQHLRITGFDWIEHNDTLLVGTERGLYYLDGDSIKPYSRPGMQLDNPVYTLMRATSGALWLGTNLGVLAINGDNIRHFTERNGLIGNEVNRGALVEGSGGRVYIGTQNGVSVFIPEEDYVRSTAPLVQLERITVISDYSTLSLSNIPYAYNNLQVDYRAVSFASWPRLTVSYKLEGLHNDWITVENPRDNKLFLNNLPPGEYRLLLKAGLGSQSESEVVYSDPFKVAYPYYLQGWFIAIVVLVFVGLGILINFLFVQYKYQDLLKSDLHKKTQEIEKKDDQFKNVWNSSDDGLMLSVLGGQIVAANPALCRMAGVTEEELIQHGLSYLFADSGYSTARENITRGVERENGVIVEMTMPFKKGEREVEVYITRMQTDYDGKPFFLNIMKDITQKKEYQKSLRLAKDRAEEVSRLKSSILSNMSHEIKTPLNGILGSAENIMLSRQEDADLLSQMAIIKESGERLLHTINAILDLSKIQADSSGVEYKEVNVNEFLSKLLLPLKAGAVQKGVLVSAKQLERPFIAKLPCAVFEVVVNNVVSNAIKYSDKGMVTVWLDRRGDRLYLKVVDQGIGISKDYLAKLFIPFEQESKGYDRKFEGAGLGLAVTKHLLDQLSGSISVQSEKGVGTTVEVEIPLLA